MEKKKKMWLAKIIEDGGQRLLVQWKRVGSNFELSMFDSRVLNFKEFAQVVQKLSRYTRHRLSQSSVYEAHHLEESDFKWLCGLRYPNHPIK